MKGTPGGRFHTECGEEDAQINATHDGHELFRALFRDHRPVAIITSILPIFSPVSSPLRLGVCVASTVRIPEQR